MGIVPKSFIGTVTGGAGVTSTTIYTTGAGEYLLINSIVFFDAATITPITIRLDAFDYGAVTVGVGSGVDVPQPQYTFETPFIVPFSTDFKLVSGNAGYAGGTYSYIVSGGLWTAGGTITPFSYVFSDTTTDSMTLPIYADLAVTAGKMLTVKSVIIQSVLTPTSGTSLRQSVTAYLGASTPFDSVQWGYYIYQTNAYSGTAPELTQYQYFTTPFNIEPNWGMQFLVVSAGTGTTQLNVYVSGLLTDI